MGEWMERLRGRFVVFDGPDGSGKSTQFARFAAAARDGGIPVTEVREPGGTPIGEQIRHILLDPANGGLGMSIRCEMLLYMASRAQLVEERVRPTLQRGDLVLADRFISSTFAYQGTAGGIPRAEIEAVGRAAVGTIWPDLTVIFDVDEHSSTGRLGPSRDRIEQRDREFHRQVRAGFLEQAEADPDRYVVIDASPDADTVTAALHDALARRFT